MAIANKIGNCFLVKENGHFKIYLRSSSTTPGTLVQEEGSEIGAAGAIRGYVRAGACY